MPVSIPFSDLGGRFNGRTREKIRGRVGRTREFTQEGLYRAIDSDDFPKWRFCVQVMPEADAKIVIG